MNFRPTSLSDVDQTFSVRASTRQNPLTIEQLAQWGITPDSVREDYASGVWVGRVCEVEARIVGFCTGCVATGEIIVVAVLPEFEGKGIGIRLLTEVIQRMRESGVQSFWLSASPDPLIRAHGFYRANGWIPKGETLENGDEILVLA
ncbi:MAG: GNAT family N-acetyltransferase [Fibrobacterota bacterium]|nr:GNAT family N-acetyltransferase [Fibrobacterota bacterium]QQS07243.1 MAG: GNAT family N-acetyltransferase [Fibrobacterota bacterium]